MYRRIKSDSAPRHSLGAPTAKSSRQVFTKEFIHVCIYQDSVQAGRTLLFDSQTSLPEDKSPQIPKQSASVAEFAKRNRAESYTVKGRKASSGVDPKVPLALKHFEIDKQLLDMMFGTVPVTSSGITYKVHHLPQRNQILVTVVFQHAYKPSDHRIAVSTEQVDSRTRKRSLSHRTMNLTPPKHSSPVDPQQPSMDLPKPVAIPEKQETNNHGSSESPSRVRSLSFSHEKPSGSSPVEGDLKRTHKRQSSVQEKSPAQSSERTYKSTLAIGILIDVLTQSFAVQDMFNSHFPLIHYRLRILAQLFYDTILRIQKCKLSTPMNYQNVQRSSEELNNSPYFSKHALQRERVLHSAVEDFQKCICSFMTYPRLQPPSWLEITSVAADQRKTIIADLLQELNSLVNLFEKQPNGNHLLSKALTALLSYHLTWVTSVINSSNESEENYVNIAALRDMDAYDPTHKQVCQLFGCISSPPRTCRVIVMGDNQALVSSVLFFLSFFIRCAASSIRLEEQQITQPTIRSPGQHRISINQSADAVSKPSQKNPHPMVGSVRATSPVASIESHSFHEVDPLSQTQGIFRNEHDFLYIVDNQPPKWQPIRPSINPYKSVGRSLFGAYCNSYASDFVIMGVSSRETVKTQLKSSIARDLWAQCKFWPVEHSMLSTPSHVGSRAFQLESASCILIDTDKRFVKIYCFEPTTDNSSGSLFRKQIPSKAPHVSIRTHEHSPILKDTLVQISDLLALNVPPESCIMFLEDKLAQIFHLSQLVKRVVFEDDQRIYTCSDLANLLRLSRADVEMLAVLQSHLDDPELKLRTLLDPA
jgi:hypothetical protein